MDFCSVESRDPAHRNGGWDHVLSTRKTRALVYTAAPIFQNHLEVPGLAVRHVRAKRLSETLNLITELSTVPLSFIDTGNDETALLPSACSRSVEFVNWKPIGLVYAPCRRPATILPLWSAISDESRAIAKRGLTSCETRPRIYRSGVVC